MLWTIMICTLKERAPLFETLVRKIEKQIAILGLANDVELSSYLDNRELTVGAKRNKLLKEAQGKYVSFVDDDDDVSINYVNLLFRGICQDKDCLSLEGVITTNGKDPRRFSHSIKYKEYSKVNGIYYRPPNHLNVIKKELVKAFPFPEKNFGEDFDWSMRICRAGVLKTEVLIPETVYFYRSVSRK